MAKTKNSTSPRLRTNYTPDMPTRGEKNSGEIVTVQGDSLTIPEMMRKYAQGIAPPAGREAVWENPSDFGESPTERLRRPDVDLVDKAEAEQYIKDVRKKLADSKEAQVSQGRKPKTSDPSEAQGASRGSSPSEQEILESASTSPQTTAKTEKLAD